MDIQQSNTSNSDPLNAAIRRVEMQQANLQLNIQFQKNMAFFQQADPDIFQQFNEYQAETIKLQFSPEGFVNLVNHNLGDSPVYKTDPESFCQRFVDTYAKEPIYYKITARQQEVLGGENDAHIHHMIPLVQKILDAEQVVLSKKIDPHTNFLMMMGIGLGYQIPQLLEKTDIHHLVIMEPHKDIFYASLHTVDWEEIFKHFDQQDHSIKYLIGQSSMDCYDNLRVHLNTIGIHNAIKPFFFEHLVSKETKETAKTFFDRVPAMVTSMGYFDDEQTSIAHTVHNYRAKIPILRTHPLIDKEFLDQPAFIVGNGPSLDLAKDFLQQHGQQGIIFSCGSSIGSIRKIGVQADFHVELERTRPIVEWLEESSSEAYREKMTLLALNTVPPDCFKLFPRSGLGIKASDLGTHFVSQLINDDAHLVALPFSNPTVVNTGITFAIALGFKNIYLFGVDLGFPHGDKHHSSLSIHYDVKEEHEEILHLHTPEKAGDKQIDGNFGGKVLTDSLYNHSRQAIESLLSMNPEVRCYNTSDGAFIEGTQSIRYEDIQLDNTALDKKQVIDKIFSRSFNLDGLKPLGSDKEIQTHFDYAINLMEQFMNLFKETPTTAVEAFSLLNRHHNIALHAGLNKTTQYAFSLIRGSVHGFNLALAKCLYTRATEKESVQLFNDAKVHYLDFLEHAIYRVKNELFKDDDRDRNLRNILKTTRD